MEKNYIEELRKANKVIELERAFENEYSQLIKVVTYIENDAKTLTIIIADKTFKLIKAFYASSFDCKPIDKHLPYLYEKMQKSEKYADPEEVRRFYLRFMRKNFDTYEADFRAYNKEQDDYDLGITTSL